MARPTKDRDREDRDDRKERPDRDRGADGEKGGRAPVIKLVHGAEMTGGERFLRRVLPASVISGGLHLLIAGGALVWSLLAGNTPEAAARNDIAVVAEDKDKDPPKDDLTRTDEGEDSLKVTSIDTTPREEDVTVDTKITDTTQPVGAPDANSSVVKDSVATYGLPDLTNDVGMKNVGPGAGFEGIGGQSGSAFVNTAFAGRSAASRNKMVNEKGGSKGSELAVGRGLAWLALQQKPDGSWVYDGASRGATAASTGMGLLPFLAAGQTHNKPGKENKYQKTVALGLEFLLKKQKADGSFSENMYEHAIAAVAVCEAYGMTRDKAQLLAPTQAAINFIQAAQGANGSWGYRAKSEGDTSIVGWQVQALQSAKLCKDIKVDKAVIERAMSFLDKVASGSRKARYGYTSPEANRYPLTAVGLLCRYYCNGWGPTHPGYQDGVDHLIQSWLPDDKTKPFDMYYFYYATQVMHFAEGEQWEKVWNPKMREFLIDLQVKDEGKKATFGSWDPDKGSWIGPQCGRVGTTCMALLTLEVYYRHIPLYRRDASGLKEVDRMDK